MCPGRLDAGSKAGEQDFIKDKTSLAGGRAHNNCYNPCPDCGDQGIVVIAIGNYLIISSYD